LAQVYENQPQCIQGCTQGRGFGLRTQDFETPPFREAKAMLLMVNIAKHYQVITFTLVQINNSNQNLKKNQHVTSLKQFASFILSEPLFENS